MPITMIVYLLLELTFIARFEEQDLPRKYHAKLEALEQTGSAAATPALLSQMS